MDKITSLTEKEILANIDEEKFYKTVSSIHNRIYGIYNETIRNTESQFLSLTMAVWMECLLDCLVSSIQKLVHKNSQKIVFSRMIKKLKNEMLDCVEK